MTSARILTVVIVALPVCFGGAQAQDPVPRLRSNQIPIFRTKGDSASFHAVQETIRKVLVEEKSRDDRKLDSLHMLRNKLLAEAMIGVRTEYRPTRGYIVTDSLEKLTSFDGIRHVTVYRKNSLPEVLWKCTDLEVLELVHTSIDILPESLDALQRLTTINIYNNGIRRRLRLESNSRVTSLSFRGDSPDALPRSYKKFKALVKLDLAENHIARFPNGARHNKMLQELNLQRNRITLRNRMRPHASLEKLALQENAIERVPRSIGNFGNLKKLTFNANRISHVHRRIGKLKNLEHLSLYKNNLTIIPQGVYSLSRLKEIDLFHNQIGYIDPAIAQLRDLETLYISHNKLVALPENIHELPSLTGLYAWENRLGKLPDNLAKMKQLKFLRVNNNYLKAFPAGMANLANIEELDISHNYIASIPECLFGYPHLRILAIVDNPFDAATRAFLPSKVEELRAKEIFVHVSGD